MKRALLIVLVMTFIGAAIAFFLVPHEGRELPEKCYGVLVLPDGTETLLYRSQFACDDEDNIFSAPVAMCNKGDIATVYLAEGSTHDIVCVRIVEAEIEDDMLFIAGGGECIHYEADYLFYLIGDEMKCAYVWLWDIVCPGC